MFTTVLMIEKPLVPADVDLLTGLHDGEQVAFVVLMQPRGDQDRLLRALDDVALGRLGQVMRETDEEEEAALPVAVRSLEHSLAALRAGGAEATGRVVEDDPLKVLRSVVEESGADEVVVLTSPHLVEEFFHRDWASRARHKVGVPVLKLFAHNE
ncbi:hypothetical protein GCM10027168_21500 [Streptomyces capparidis]